MVDLNRLEGLLTEILNVVKAGSACATPEPSGNRTPPVFDYDGFDPIQNVADCLRRAVRVSREGRHLTKKERNVMRKALRELKDEFDILNTNGQDFLTQNGV